MKVATKVKGEHEGGGEGEGGGDDKEYCGHVFVQGQYKSLS